MRPTWRADIMREMKDRSGLSLTQISEATGLSPSALDAYCVGRWEPSLRSAAAIADYFCIPIDVLYGMQDEGVVERVLQDYAGTFRQLRRSDYEATIRRRNKMGRDYISRDILNAPWPYNLLDDIVMPTYDHRKGGDRNECWPDILTPDQESGLKYLLSTLSDKEQAFIRGYYEEDKSLEEVGQGYGLTRERVRQVLAKSVRKLRHPARLKLIQYGLEGYEHMTANRKRREQLEAEDRELDEMEQEIARRRAFLECSYPLPQKTDNTGATPVDMLGLTVRSYNCLKRNNCNTLDDVCKAAKDGELLKIRNLGRKSLAEILGVVREMSGEDYRGVYV